MTTSQYQDLIKYIKANHKFGDKGKHIKYIDATLDMRTNDYFYLKLRGLGSEFEMAVTNENRDKDLYCEAMKFLTN